MNPKLLEWLNLSVFGSIGILVCGYAITRYLILGDATAYGPEPFRHSPETFIIAGVGLIALCWKHKLYGVPMFFIAANLVELPWLMYSPLWNVYQLTALGFGYLLSRPKFKSLGWVVAVIAINEPGGVMTYLPILYNLPFHLFGFFYYHHLAEIATILMFLYNVKSLRAPWSRTDTNAIL